MEDFLLRLAGRAGAFSYLDLPQKVESLALASFCCCLLGDLGAFPLASNLGIALLGLVAIRARSEAQLISLCGFIMFTAVGDLFFVCTEADSWGGVFTVMNMVLKLGMGQYAFRMYTAFDALAAAGDIGEIEPPEHDGGSSSFPAASYTAPPPLGDPNPPGDVTR
jgi:hypothetical protein